MSHRPQRKEKDCLNCGATVLGKYCQNCGQENTEPGMTLAGLIRHFFYDITHFDGKFFLTAKKLITRPGFLSLEFLKGRRASYLDPVRMYIFTSAFFFLLFFGVFINMNESKLRKDFTERNEFIRDLTMVDTTADYNFDFVGNLLIRDKKDTILDMSDTAAYRKFRDSLRLILKMGGPATGKVPKKKFISFLDTITYKTRAEYDSVQQTRPKEERHSWIKRLVIYREIAINEEFGGDFSTYLASVLDRFVHSFPTILFVSLPVLAVLLKLLYIRKKKVLLVNHGIYLIHTYIFIFLWMILYFGFRELNGVFKTSFFSWFNLVLVIWLLIYIYKAQRRFYGEGRFKTILKYLAFVLFSFIIIVTLFVGYFAYIALKV